MGDAVSSRPHRLGLGAILVAACSPLGEGKVPNVPPNDAPIRLEVDAREAGRKLLHAHLRMAVTPGPVTLLYPKWIPGEHGPTGPIVNLAGLKLTANGAAIPWRRDDVDMFAIHVDVPAGATALDVALDLISPQGTDGFSASASATEELVDLSWNQLLLYPAGRDARAWKFAPSVVLPAGWKYATALEGGTKSGDAVGFAPVALERLVDSPLIAGAHFRTVDLGKVDGRDHAIQLVADSDAALAMPDATIDAYKHLVTETGALFGARHYARYQFLFTLSDHVGTFGLEHHESSDDRTPERAMVDDSKRKEYVDLLPHEFVHSWNGKYRRPAGLATPDYQAPMKGELLWVYEGLTQYLGTVLTARSGLWTDAETKERIAMVAAQMDSVNGRGWRPLEDTAVAAQVLYAAPSEWNLLRRDVDFYPEGVLLWLEVDATIRKETRGAKSLDDFCRAFFGGGTGGPEVKPYTFDDVVSALNQVAPHDWRALLRARLSSTDPRAPLGGIVASGYALTYDDIASDVFTGADGERKTTSFTFSLGMAVKEDGTIGDFVPSSPAGQAGLAPGVRIVAVNGRKYTPDALHDALAAAKEPGSPKLELIVENGEFYRTVTIDYRGGDRYPHLTRDPKSPDLLTAILAPHAESADPGRDFSPRGRSVGA